MFNINPKTLEDAKTVIEKTVTSAPQSKLQGVQNALDGINSFIDGCVYTTTFIKNSITDPHFLIDQLKGVAPDFVLIALAILVVLNFIGFKKANKYTVLVLVVAFLISIM